MEELIEAVRSEKCLYDVKHPDYGNVILKDNIWTQIAHSLNIKNGGEAKKTWERLRNNHRDALRRQKKPKSGVPKRKPWRYQENMEFLIPYITNRITNTNIDNNQPSQAYSDTTEDEIKDNEESENLNEEIIPFNESQSTDVLANDVHSRRRQKRRIINDFQYRSFRQNQPKILSRQQKYLGTNTRNIIRSNVKNDPLFHFFMSMYETTKRLPPLSQHTIKVNIFSLVSQEESKHLIHSLPRPHSNNS